MPAPPCVRCSRNDSSPKNFLLSCKGCSRCWHHRCHIPEVSDAELIARIRAFNVGEIQNGIHAWMCRRCSKRADKNKPKAGTETAPMPVPEGTPIPISSGGSVASKGGNNDWREEPSSSSVEVVASYVKKPSVTRNPQGEESSISTSLSHHDDRGSNSASAPQSIVTRSFLRAKVNQISAPLPQVQPREEKDDDSIVLLPTPPRQSPAVPPQVNFQPSPSPADIEDMYASPIIPPAELAAPVAPAQTPAGSEPVATIRSLSEYDLAPNWMRKYVEQMDEPDAWQRCLERRELQQTQCPRKPRKALAKRLARLGTYKEVYFSTDVFHAQNPGIVS